MRPFEGLLVVSVEQAVAAPLCTSRLADAGARVVKVERPEGDFARNYDKAVHGEATHFVWINRGKESICLDLKGDADRALLGRLIAKADVFVQNLAPGAMARLGFGSSALRDRHPRLITCDISGYGEDGPYREMKAYDFLIQGESGLLAVSGEPETPGRIGVSVCDIAAGMNALIGIEQALYRRVVSGEGASLRVSLFDAAVDWMTVPLLHQTYGAGAPPRVGLKHPTIAPYGAFRCSDGEMLLIAVQNDREWASLCTKVLGRPELVADARTANNPARVSNRGFTDSAVADLFSRSPRGEIEAKLRAADIAFGGINSVESLAMHPQLRTWPMNVGGTQIRMAAPPVQADWDAGTFGEIPAKDAQGAKIRAEFG